MCHVIRHAVGISSLDSTCRESCEHALAAEEIEDKYRDNGYRDRCKCSSPVCQAHASDKVIQTEGDGLHRCGPGEGVSVDVVIPAEHGLHRSYGYH